MASNLQVFSLHQRRSNASSHLSDCDADEGLAQTHTSILKLHCTHGPPRHGQPWTHLKQFQSTATGFVYSVPEGWEDKMNTGGAGDEGEAKVGVIDHVPTILTNAHAVEHAKLVQVQKKTDPKKYEARVLFVGPDCDLALLTVKDTTFWQGLQPVRCTQSIAMEEPVTVVGFPTGGDNTSVTLGVVSRITTMPYDNMSAELLVIQTDAAINPGNSGGPALNKNKECVGIAFSSLQEEDVENIGYVIPISVVEHFLTDCQRNGRYTGFGDPGFSVKTLENQDMRRALGLTDKQGHHGVIVSKVHAASPAAGLIKLDDIILQVDNHDINLDATIQIPSGERVNYGWLFAQKFVGDKAEIVLMRESAIHTVTLPIDTLQLQVPAHLKDPTTPEYLIVGGCVFVVLSEPYLQYEYGASTFDTKAPGPLIHMWREVRDLTEPGGQVVLLSHVLAHESTAGFEKIRNVILKKFNRTPVKNLRHLVDLVENNTEPWLRFDLDMGFVVILDAKTYKAHEEDIMKRSLIPRNKSANL
ncbi:unnamed protein product [Vitrella brassicaformis CCMP3155]|uniref:PDZ domain-containing protein n=1 Tax=Vitrella brassicaformis (strain CCMP3155) TaxID=1169540 RepID=A0A0G4GY50_VITBC|nr:unnamed protein product [Vitrella brassicaformis CCMP3155]|eukprot:CEM35896.1 unnamed protein product [Vitrella brassicaformis CCMP3155]